MSGEDLLAGGLGDTVGQRELEVLGEELLDVRAADLVGLLDLDDLDDLQRVLEDDGRPSPAEGMRRTWIERKRER